MGSREGDAFSARGMNPITREPRAYGPLRLATSILLAGWREEEASLPFSLPLFFFLFSFFFSASFYLSFPRAHLSTTSAMLPRLGPWPAGRYRVSRSSWTRAAGRSGTGGLRVHTFPVPSSLFGFPPSFPLLPYPAASAALYPGRRRHRRRTLCAF